MKIFACTWLATLVTFLILDAAYLGGFAKSFFESQLGPGVLAAKPVLSAAALFYLMYAVGVTYFIGVPNGLNGQLMQAALWGAGFGLVAYGTYDLTNMATISGWTWNIVVVDMAWGTLATAIGALAGAYTAMRLAH